MEMIEFLLDFVIKHGDASEYQRAVELKASLKSLRDVADEAREVGEDAS